MPKIIAIECWVAVNANGDHEVGCSMEEASERLEEAHGGDGEPRRVICCTPTTAVPEIVNLRAEIPNDADRAQLMVA